MILLYTCLLLQGLTLSISNSIPISPNSTFPFHWLVLHYHKTGHDITRAIFEPIAKALDISIADNLGPRRSLWRLEDYLGEGKLGYIPYFHSRISIQGGAEMHFKWNDHINFDYKVLHFVRDPFEYVVSAYLYHTQVPPPPEKFVRHTHYNPCGYSKPKLDTYVEELVLFGEDESFIRNALNATIMLCRNLHVQGPLHRELHRLEVEPPNEIKALQLEACRSIVSDEIDAGGDLLRMVVNSLREKEAGSNRARRVFLSEFPIMNQTVWQRSMNSVLTFLYSHNRTQSRRNLAASEDDAMEIDRIANIAFSNAFINNTDNVQNKIKDSGG
jgi:hypothetical protein